jgi:autotransporter-associated beta strand protein
MALCSAPLVEASSDGYWTGGANQGSTALWWTASNWFNNTVAEGQGVHAHFGEFIASGSHTVGSGPFASPPGPYAVDINPGAAGFTLGSPPFTGPDANHLRIGEIYFNDASAVTATALAPKVWTIFSSDPSYGFSLHGGGGNQQHDINVVQQFQVVDFQARFDNPGGGGNPTQIVKQGPGTVILSNPANTFDGGITVNQGTFALGANNVIPDGNNLTLNGGTFSTGLTYSTPGAAYSDTLGTLTLTANSVIDMGNGASILNFAASNLAVWTPGTTLSIWNWSGNPGVGGGTDQIYVGDSLSGLTVAQLNQISFYSGAGTGFLGTAIILADGEIVPVPEPGALMSTLLLLTVVGWRERGLVLRRRQAVA